MEDTEKEMINLQIGGVHIALASQVPLSLLDGTAAFLFPGGPPNVTVEVLAEEKLPIRHCEKSWDDGMFRFYRDGAYWYEEALEGVNGSVFLAEYDLEFSWIKLHLNEGAFPNVVRTVDKVLQLLPMKQLLAHYGAFLLHSSRICVTGNAILFTAPSQTGKTTQARLWQEYAGAEIAGNDRTLLWTRGEQVLTGGYPVDGSSPVYSSERTPLGAIVVLRQAPENRVLRLPASRALLFLMEQTALNAWNAEERAAAQRFWLKLLERCPVYLLQCRPDREAVTCLRKQLEKDEVITIGTDPS